MINNEDSVNLSEYYFNLCLTLETATQGKSVDNLGRPVRTALDDLERCVD